MTEYERDLQLWVKGLTDRELSECIASNGDFSDAELDALILEDWRRMRIRKLGAGLSESASPLSGIAVDSTP